MSRGTSRKAELLEVVKPVINEEMNSILRLFSPKRKLGLLANRYIRLRHLGPMACLSIFYKKKIWFILGIDIITFCLKVLNDGRSLDDVNKTFIVLIMKIKNLEKLSQFRLISLFNVLYKIIAKAIVNGWNMSSLSASVEIKALLSLIGLSGIM